MQLYNDRLAPLTQIEPIVNRESPITANYILADTGRGGRTKYKFITGVGERTNQI